VEVKTKGVVLTQIKYGDTSLIVRIYTEQYGLQSYLLRGILKSGKGKLKAAYFLPLTQLDLTAVHRGKGLERIVDVRRDKNYSSLHTDIAKSSLSLLLVETLQNALKEVFKDLDFYRFLVNAADWLDDNDRLGHFNIVFLLGLSRFLGIEPQKNYSEGSVFDLNEGVFIPAENLNSCLSISTSFCLNQYLGIDFDSSLAIQSNKAQRMELMQSLLNYLEIHLENFYTPKSFAVLKDLYA